jgi:pentatricopeptide repeat protein
LMRMYEAHGQVDKAMEVLERMRAWRKSSSTTLP